MPRFFRRIAPGVFDLEDLESARASFRLRDRRGRDLWIRSRPRDRRRLFKRGQYRRQSDPGASGRPRRCRAAARAAAEEPIGAPDLTGLLCFLSGGLADALIGPDQTKRLAAVLQEAGAW